MERRQFLTALCAGIGASAIASQAAALMRIAPNVAVGADPGLSPRAGVATPEDLERAKVEKAFGRGYWRHRRRRSRQSGREHYDKQQQQQQQQQQQPQQSQ